jgi:hypothetical protein
VLCRTEVLLCVFADSMSNISLFEKYAKSKRTHVSGSPKWSSSHGLITPGGNVSGSSYQHPKRRRVDSVGEVLLEVDARGKGSTVASSYKLAPIFSQPLPNKPPALREMVSEVEVGVISNLGYLRR